MYIIIGILSGIIFITIIAVMLVCSCYFRHKKIDLVRALEVKNGSVLIVCSEVTVSVHINFRGHNLMTFLLGGNQETTV